MKRIAIVLIAGVAVVSVLLALAVVLGAPQPAAIQAITETIGSFRDGESS